MLPAVAYAATDDDSTSVRAPHHLNEVEVLGIKQMPTPGNSPVTRITPADIRRLGIDAVKDLGDIVPNLYSPDYGSRMTSSIYLRGLGSRIDQAVVGLTIDGVPFLNKDAYDFDLPDIASLSVLRGAQSVLNGRNAMAGQINIYTLSPRDFRGMRAMVEYGRANSVKAAIAGYFDLAETGTRRCRHTITTPTDITATSTTARAPAPRTRGRCAGRRYGPPPRRCR